MKTQSFVLPIGIIFFIVSQVFTFENNIRYNKIPVKNTKNIKFTLVKTKEIVKLYKGTPVLCSEFNSSKKFVCFFSKKVGSFVQYLRPGKYTSIFKYIKHQKKGFWLKGKLRKYLNYRYHQNNGEFKITFHEVSQTRAIVKNMPTNHVHLEMRFVNYQDVESSIFLSEVKTDGIMILLYSKSIKKNEKIMIATINKKTGILKLHVKDMIEYFGGKKNFNSISDKFDLLGRGEYFESNSFKPNCKVKANTAIYELAYNKSTMIAKVYKNSRIQHLGKRDIYQTFKYGKQLYQKVRIKGQKEGFIENKYLNCRK